MTFTVIKGGCVTAKAAAAATGEREMAQHLSYSPETCSLAPPPGNPDQTLSLCVCVCVCRPTVHLVRQKPVLLPMEITFMYHNHDMGSLRKTNE